MAWLSSSSRDGHIYIEVEVCSMSARGWPRAYLVALRFGEHFASLDLIGHGHISVKTGHISMKLPRVCMGCLSSFERVIVLVARLEHECATHQID